MRRLALMVLAFAGLALGPAAPAHADVYDDNPAAAARASSDLNVFARAADGRILWRKWDGNIWVPWDSLGGATTSGPTAASTRTSCRRESGRAGSPSGAGRRRRWPPISGADR